MIQNDEDQESDADEVRSELTQLTDRLREAEDTSSSVTAQICFIDAAVEDDTKLVCGQKTEIIDCILKKDNWIVIIFIILITK